MKKIKVLHVIGTKLQGGIATVIYNYQSHLKCEDIQMDYLIFAEGDPGRLYEKVINLGSRVYVLPALKNLRLFKIIYEINKFMKETGGQYDILHLHSVNIGFLCFPLARKYGVRHLIAHSHATEFSDKRLNAARNKILCMGIRRRAEIKMACSKAAGEFLYGKEYMKDVIVLKNAVDCGRFAFCPKARERVRKELELEGQFVLGNIGRFSRQKNHAFLIEIFEQVVALCANAALLLIGDGPLKEQVVSLVEQKKLNSKVHFLGYQEKVSDFMQAMDLLVLPSLFEGLPVAGIEAQAAGLPCIVSTAVTEEMDVGLTTYLDLDSGSRVWAEKIMEMRNVDKREKNKYENIDMKSVERRKQGRELVSLAGYDIEVEAEKLRKFYLGIDDHC